MIPCFRPFFASVAFLVATVSLSGSAVADYLITVTGTYASSSNETYRDDGTNAYANDLPPLLDLDRLKGGTFTASFLFPQVTPVTGGTNATYSFGPSYGMTFTLFDPSGAAVHQGSNSSDAFALIFNDINFQNGPVDQASFFAFVNTVTNLHTPSTLYTTDQAAYALQSGFLFSGAVTATTNYLNDLSIPTDAATYLRFPDRQFTTGVEWTDGDGLDFNPPYQIIDTSVSYDIKSVQITAVPEPGSLVLLASAAIAGLAVWPLRHRKGRSVSVPNIA